MGAFVEANFVTYFAILDKCLGLKGVPLSVMDPRRAYDPRYPNNERENVTPKGNYVKTMKGSRKAVVQAHNCGSLGKQ